MEVSAGNPEASARRLEALEGMAELPIDEEVKELADKLISQGGFPLGAEPDASHVAVAAVHQIDYLLTWNFRHIDNAAKKPIIRAICSRVSLSGNLHAHGTSSGGYRQCTKMRS